MLDFAQATCSESRQQSSRFAANIKAEPNGTEAQSESDSDSSKNGLLLRQESGSDDTLSTEEVVSSPESLIQEIKKPQPPVEIQYEGDLSAVFDDVAALPSSAQKMGSISAPVENEDKMEVDDAADTPANVKDRKITICAKDDNDKCKCVEGLVQKLTKVDGYNSEGWGYAVDVHNPKQFYPTTLTNSLTPQELKDFIKTESEGVPQSADKPGPSKPSTGVDHGNGVIVLNGNLKEEDSNGSYSVKMDESTNNQDNLNHYCGKLPPENINNPYLIPTDPRRPPTPARHNAAVCVTYDVDSIPSVQEVTNDFALQLILQDGLSRTNDQGQLQDVKAECKEVYIEQESPEETENIGNVKDESSEEERCPSPNVYVDVNTDVGLDADGNLDSTVVDADDDDSLDVEDSVCEYQNEPPEAENIGEAENVDEEIIDFETAPVEPEQVTTMVSAKLEESDVVVEKSMAEYIDFETEPEDSEPIVIDSPEPVDSDILAEEQESRQKADSGSDKQVLETSSSVPARSSRPSVITQGPVRRSRRSQSSDCGSQGTRASSASSASSCRPCSVVLTPLTPSQLPPVRREVIETEDIEPTTTNCDNLNNDYNDDEDELPLAVIKAKLKKQEEQKQTNHESPAAPITPSPIVTPKSGKRGRRKAIPIPIPVIIDSPCSEPEPAVPKKKPGRKRSIKETCEPVEAKKDKIEEDEQVENSQNIVKSQTLADHLTVDELLKFITDESSKIEPNFDLLTEAMNRTYPNRKVNIYEKAQVELAEVMECPALVHYQMVKEEYGRIKDDITKMEKLERELETTYMNSLEGKAKKLMKGKPKKKDPLWQDVLQFWKDNKHKESENPLYRRVPGILAVCFEFAEDAVLKNFFRVLENGEKLKKADEKKMATPTIVVKKNDLFTVAGSADIWIYVDGKKYLLVPNMYQAVLCSFATYYILNIDYNKKLKNLFEFFDLLNNNDQSTYNTKAKFNSFTK